MTKYLSGKTTTAEKQAKSVIKMQDPDKSRGYLVTADTKPSLLLAGENPRLIDEWQIAPVKMLFSSGDNNIDGAKSDLSVEQLIFTACRGGWPASLSKKTDKAALFIASSYLDTIYIRISF